MASRILMYTRFAAGFPVFLRKRLTPEAARATIEARLKSREENFLRLVRHTVLERPESPYNALMRDAGVEHGDIETLVRADGLDSALSKIEKAGVRVTFDEFKGRAPLVRGGRTIEVGPESFDNPLGVRGFESQTTGSTGRPTRVNMDLGHIASMAPMRLLSQVSNGVYGWPTIVYRAGLPSSAAVGNVIQHIVMGNPIRRWFSPVGPRDLGAPLRFRVAGQLMPALARIAGTPFPKMEVVPTTDADQVARAARELVKREGHCLVRCAVSTSLAVAVAAVDNGIDLHGVTFMGAAEPATPAKVRGIRRSGAKYITHFGMNEAGMVGAGCADGLDDTDVHFMRDSLAVVPGSRPLDVDDESLSAFVMTSLMPTAPKIMINVDIGDFGILEERACGCLLGELGFTQHLRQIRSTAKLTGRGVTLVGSDVVRIIEELMPSRFGGTAMDYQLVEEEDGEGRTMLTLLVNPAILLNDERAPASLLYEELSRGRPGASFSGAILRGGDAVRVRRERPRPNARGKQPAFRIAAASA